MAGSISHVVDDQGRFRMDLIENLGDAEEALREFYDFWRGITEGIEIVTPHRSGCGGPWKLKAASHSNGAELIEGQRPTLVLDCCDDMTCPAEARIPEALLCELVEASSLPGTSRGR